MGGHIVGVGHGGCGELHSPTGYRHWGRGQVGAPAAELVVLIDAPAVGHPRHSQGASMSVAGRNRGECQPTTDRDR